MRVGVRLSTRLMISGISADPEFAVLNLLWTLLDSIFLCTEGSKRTFRLRSFNLVSNVA